MLSKAAYLLSGLVFSSGIVLAAHPNFSTQTCPVLLNGTAIGSALTPGNSSLRNTVAYEPS